MALKFNGTTGYLELASRLVSAYPYTFAVWVSRDSNATQMTVIGQQQSTADRSHRAYFQGGTDLVVGRVSTNVSGGVSVTNNAVIPNATMRLLMFVVTSPSSMSLYHDSATPTTAAAVADDIVNHDRFTLGADHYNNAAVAAFLNGSIAEAAVFNVALTASDFATLKGGAKAETVTGCVKCFPLRDTTDLTSTDGLTTLTLVGGVTNSAQLHPISRAAADTIAPTLLSSAVANATPTIVNLTMSEAMDAANVPAASAFAVSGHTVSSVAISGSTINLTCSAAFVFGEAASTVSYTQPGANNARDLAGNLLANFSAQAITNNVAAADTIAPTASSAAVANATPTFVDITMSEAMDTGFTPAASSLTVSGHTVNALVWASSTVLRATVSAPFVFGEAAQTAAYTQPGTNNARDVAGNLLANFSSLAITNNVASTDTIAPSFSSAQVADAAKSDIVITMSETLAAFTPAASAFAVSGGKTVSSVARSGATITLTCSAPYAYGDTITVTYTKPVSNMLQDAAGNQTANFGPSSVTNNIAVPAQPTFTPTPAGKNINSGARASVPCRVAVYSLTSDALIGIKTGLTSTSAGVPPPFQLASGAVAGVQYLCKAVADANNADLGVFLCTPA